MRGVKLIQRDLVRFTVRGPGKGRASFSILKDTKKSNGKREYEIVEDERISAINSQLKSGKPAHECEDFIREIRKELQKKYQDQIEKIDFCHENEKVLSQYWQKEYSGRNLADRAAALNDLRRAVFVLGNLPLNIATQEDIQKKISKLKPNTQRRVVARLKQILRFLGRNDVKLYKEKEVLVEVKSISEAELGEILKQVSDEIVWHLINLGFSSGCRIGEIFSLNINSVLKECVLKVESQN